MWLKFQLSASFPLPLKPPDPRCCLVPGSLNDYSFLYMVGVFSLILTRCNKLGTSPAPPPKPPDPSCYLIPEKEFQLQTNKVWLNRHIRAVLRNHAYEVSDKRISKISCYLELLLKPKLIVWRSVTIGIAIAIGCLAQFKETIVTAIGLYTLDSTNQKLLLLLNIAFSTITYDAIFYYGLLVCNFVELPLKIITQPKVDGPVNCDEVRFVHQDMMRFTGLQLNDVAAGHNISLLQFKSAGIYEIVKQTLVLVDPTVASIGNNLDVHGFNISFGAGAACLENYAKKSFTKVVHRNSDIFGSAMQKPFYLDQVKATFIVLLPCYIVCVMDASRYFKSIVKNTGAHSSLQING
ncbi:hypothetical protein RIF29_15926 [Crotalaria pallida]|uniref:Uncharacterized protein n=1 Tax=Crotalaria pallida TaxID=3830 RepID=A0AAN9FE61_CROPI